LGADIPESKAASSAKLSTPPGIPTEAHTPGPLLSELSHTAVRRDSFISSNPLKIFKIKILGFCDRHMATLRAATGGDENRCATACRRGLASAVFRGQLSWSQLIDFKLDIGGPFPRTRDFGATQPPQKGMKTGD